MFEYVLENTLEADLEEWARKEIKLAGGRMYKWVIPATKGPPDNICFWPERVVHFLEFKNGVNAPTAKLQIEFHKDLALFGHTVKIPRDRIWIRAYIDRYRPKERIRG